MRGLKRVALAVCVALAGIAPAGAVEMQTEQAARDDCSGDAEAGMTQCLVDKRDTSIQALGAAREHVRAALARWIEDARYARLAAQRLHAADQAFERYRTVECGFNRALGGGAIGNALDMRALACEVELNTTRAAQLEQLAARIRAK